MDNFEDEELDYSKMCAADLLTIVYTTLDDVIEEQCVELASIVRMGVDFYNKFKDLDNYHEAFDSFVSQFKEVYDEAKFEREVYERIKTLFSALEKQGKIKTLDGLPMLNELRFLLELMEDSYTNRITRFTFLERYYIEVIKNNDYVDSGYVGEYDSIIPVEEREKIIKKIPDISQF